MTKKEADLPVPLSFVIRHSSFVILFSSFVIRISFFPLPHDIPQHRTAVRRGAGRDSDHPAHDHAPEAEVVGIPSPAVHSEAARHQPAAAALAASLAALAPRGGD